MAIKHSNILLFTLPLIMMITMSHCHNNPQNSAATIVSSGGDLGLPIIARVRILKGLLSCAIPQMRAPRTPPVVAGTDFIMACGDHRVTLGQIVSEPPLALGYVFDVTREVVADPRNLSRCKMIVTFPGGVCGANLETFGGASENVAYHGQTYSVPVYEAKEFHGSDKHY